HCNSSASSNTARGVETYWHWRRPGSRRLAQALHRRLVLATGNNDRGVRSNRDLCVTRESGMPSVLLELGFIDNPQDEAQLASPDFQRLLAEELTLGVLEFFGTDLPPSG
ncbi:MAG: N-acetylmuramoyl-L-alanine amidase, partial [Armatimonadetes bacterium]|nr:N-acetylmuramoyl-L-alanine amidase [Armatimonadota bacterium]